MGFRLNVHLFGFFSNNNTISSTATDQQQAPNFDTSTFTQDLQTPSITGMDFVDPLADSTFHINYPSTTPHIPTTTMGNKRVVPSQPGSSLGPPPLGGMTNPPSLKGMVPTPISGRQTESLIIHHHKRPRINNNPTNQNMQTTIVQATPTQTFASISTYTHTATNPTANIIANPIELKPGNHRSQAQVDRRRERNRILARRTRLRKKFFFESLQKEVMDFQKENLVLKEIVKSKFDAAQAKELLDTCKANEQLPQVVLEHCGDPSTLGQKSFNLMSSIERSQHSFIITDPSLQDNPIVYASEGFLQVTGYSRDQVLGRNCRFLQGPNTSQSKVAEIRKGLEVGDDVSATILNYCADGTPFWNKLFIAALRDAHNNIVNYIGVTVKVACDDEDENFDDIKQEDLVDDDGDHCVDADAAIQAIEGAVTKAVAAAPNITKSLYSQ